MIYQIFKEALEQYPEAIALINSHGQHSTYAELDQTIQQWAHYLYELGIEPQDRVAVLLENEDFHVPIFLALERLNASYIPFDQDVPAQQLAQDLKRLAPKRCLRDADFSPEVLEKIRQCPRQFQAIPYQDQGAEKITYWVSSSGTTGEKKWIPILGEGLIYWAKQLRELMQLKPNDKVLATRSPAYDARIFEYLEAFACGSTLCLIDRNQRKDFQAIVNTCEQYQITSLLFIASQFGESHLDDLLGRFKQAQLKYLLVTGDACSVQLKQGCEKHQIFLLNCYGPTEATFGYSLLCVNGLDLWSDGRLTCVPIGKAWGKEVRYHIIDEKLYIESPYLSPGYLNSEEDSHYFIEKATDVGKVRLFDTQDRFVEQNGYLYYLGRYSYGHCKINGVKVTSDFIEACMNDYNRYNPLMQIQVAVVIKNYLNQAKPFAYVVVSADFDKTRFHTYLQDHLKVEEMPIIIPLDALPRMQPSAKINRQALISREDDLDAWLSDLSPACAKPIDSTIEDVRGIWKNLFRRHTIPDDMEFLFLGGTSLTATEMVRQIQVTLDPNYSYQRLLQLQTITVQNIAQSLHHSNPCFEEEKALIQPLLNDKKPKKATPLFFLPALLGEGYFSYRELAQAAFRYLSQPMYGLSDPGILNSEWLPTNMEHAVKRYIAAIRSIQAHGPYELLGFSFGSTLVYAVTKSLLEQGEQVKELHLIDSFPPMIYQALNDEDRHTLLQALLHFLLPVFNNAFYAEQLKPAHVESGFSRLSKQLKNPQSQRLLTMAQRHLEFMQEATLPEEPLPLCPTIYFTKRDQTYLNVINQIGISKSSADYRFYGWNRYFNSVRRSGIELDCEHLGALKAQHDPYRY